MPDDLSRCAPSTTERASIRSARQTDPRDAARVPARLSLLKMAARYQKAFSIPDGFPQILKAFTREVRIRDAPF